MARRRPFWLLSVPLSLAGALLAHPLGYGIAGAGDTRPDLHGYLAHAPLLVAVCLALALVAVGLRVAGRLRGHPAAWPFALLAPLAFTFQELLERLAAGLSPAALLEPAVLAGLLVQAPLALIGFLVARGLLSCADAIGRTLARGRRAMLAPLRVAAPLPRPAPVRPALAHAGFGRAPPQR